MNKWHKKSVESNWSSRILRASQSPYTVEKQQTSTPDMQTHLAQNGRGRNRYISSRTFIVVVRTVHEMLRRFQDVANNVNKRLLIMSENPPFLKRHSLRRRFSPQRYEKYLNYARGRCKIIRKLWKKMRNYAEKRK